MPLVYREASKRRNVIAKDALLVELETLGFAKCIARNACLDKNTKEEQIKMLSESLQKQFDDFKEAVATEDKLEALADIRNVAGLLFLALK